MKLLARVLIVAATVAELERRVHALEMQLIAAAERPEEGLAKSGKTKTSKSKKSKK